MALLNVAHPVGPPKRRAVAITIEVNLSVSFICYELAFCFTSEDNLITAISLSKSIFSFFLLSRFIIIVTLVIMIAINAKVNT